MDIIYYKCRNVQNESAYQYNAGLQKREECPMRRNKIWKITMSAVVMASMASGTVLAEETQEETKEAAEQSERVKLEKYGPCGMSLAKKDEVEIEETAPLYTDEDLYVLAHAICGEGQCYPDEEQLYIGSVILNRRSHGAYPDSIQGVVFQRGQYACTWDGNYYREPTEANWRNARWLLENGSILPSNVVYQAGFRQGKGVYLQTRYHKYCYR